MKLQQCHLGVLASPVQDAAPAVGVQRGARGAQHGAVLGAVRGLWRVGGWTCFPTDDGGLAAFGAGLVAARSRFQMVSITG